MVGVLVPLPWTNVGAKAARFAPVALANVTFTVPSECETFPVWSGWHSVQAMGL